MELAKVWREAARAEGAAEAVERIGRLVSLAAPGSRLQLLRLERHRLELVGGATGRAERPELTHGQLAALEAWALQARPERLPRGLRHPLRDVLPPRLAAAELVAGPLVESGEVLGVLVVRLDPGAAGEGSLALVAELLGPFAAVLARELRGGGEPMALARTPDAPPLRRLGGPEITDAIVGAELGLRGVMERVGQVAHTDAPVVLLGETGSGKEVIARALHARSPRARGPLVRVNCGAIPPGLVDSELFGHERGSFTGAIRARAGWFERADGGTLFLDEIGELPLEAQVRLLRILQDGTFERVGAQRTQAVDVRILAATHHDLYAMVRRGTFREDLWYRISVFPIRLPPLRERREDIPALAEHFARRAGERLGNRALAPSSGDLELLLGYPWPGNVRELAAVIERAALLGGGRSLAVAAALGVGTGGLEPRAGGSSEPADAENAAAFPHLDRVVTRHVEEALRLARGRIEGPRGAAAMLGVNPHTLRARMRKLGIEWARFREPGDARMEDGSSLGGSLRRAGESRSG